MSRSMEQLETELRMIGMDPDAIKEQVKQTADGLLARPQGVADPVIGVEIVPGGGIVSEKLIEVAVTGPTRGSEPVFSETTKSRDGRRKIKRELKEIRRDIDASKQLIEEMRRPINLGEKYVSFDAMPSELQRVVKAYVEASEANKRLNEAIEALRAPRPVG